MVLYSSSLPFVLSFFSLLCPFASANAPNAAWTMATATSKVYFLLGRNASPAQKGGRLWDEVAASTSPPVAATPFVERLTYHLFERFDSCFVDRFPETPLYKTVDEPLDRTHHPLFPRTKKTLPIERSLRTSRFFFSSLQTRQGRRRHGLDARVNCHLNKGSSCAAPPADLRLQAFSQARSLPTKYFRARRRSP